MRRNTPRTGMVVTGLIALLVAGVASACVASRGPRAYDDLPAMAAITDMTSITETTAGRAETVAIVFDQPATLAEVEAGAAVAGLTVVALWRTDAVCVGAVSGAGPGGGPHEPNAQARSAFAYWHADALVARRREGPPVTDGGWSMALWDRFEHEWAQATDPAARFAGAAYVLPTAGDGPLPLTGTSTAVESYLTDGPGSVRYLAGHETALAPLFPAVTGSCP